MNERLKATGRARISTPGGDIYLDYVELNTAQRIADERDRYRAELRRMTTPLSIDEWHEDIGPVLWWHLPVCEPPYCGTPTDSGFDKYPAGWLTHWTHLPSTETIREWNEKLGGAA